MGKSSFENHGSSGNPQSLSWSKYPENDQFSGLFRVETLKGGFRELFFIIKSFICEKEF